MKLGRIHQVDLREIWRHEATNFTKWLALPENIELLSEAIDIDVSVIDTEYNVGRFNVDIYAEEPNTGRKIIVENQLERTDHDHLGKLITYASGLDAEIIIWIVKDVLEEHQQAIEWLNQNTDESLNFFAIRMEVWKISDSIPAPNFHVVSKPNNWSKAVRQTVQSASLSELKLKQLDFWDSFKDYCLTQSIPLRLRKTYPQHWYDISFGRSDCHIGLTINSQKNEFGCEIYIPDSMDTYYSYEENREEIDKEIVGLQWMELPSKKASRIKLTRSGDFQNEANWDNYFDWLSNMAMKFQDVFSRY